MAGSDDQFFEEEDELAERAQTSPRAAVRGAADSPKPKAAPSGPPAKATGHKPPSFGMVVAVAAVAVVLGYALGYLVCLSTTSRQVVSDMAQYTSGYYHDGVASSSASDDSASDEATSLNESLGLSEGHPDLSSLVNDDGSINEEALAAYKEQAAAASASQE